MSPANRTGLIALSQREFQREFRAPPKIRPQRKFKAVNVNLSKLDTAWDRKRGAAVRMMAVVMRDDDEALAQRVMASGETVRAYGEAAKWLRREASYLEKTARMMTMASGRLDVVLARLQVHEGQALS